MINIRARLGSAPWFAVVCLFAATTQAQSTLVRTTIPGSRHPLARPEHDAGRMPAGTLLTGINIVLRRSDARENDLQALLAAQQNPSSPLYHRWLTPEQFAARFGRTEAEIYGVQNWLESQGFTLVRLSRGRNRIIFSGTTAQVEAAFGTEMHYYDVAGKKHYAPASDLTVPASLAPLVQTATNLATFRPRPHVRINLPRPALSADFTSNQTKNNFLTPKDVATIYDIQAAYAAGYDGTGQAIAVVGQSFIDVTDIEHFQSAAGLPVKDPILVQVPDSGTAAPVPTDESESDLDVEYAGAIASGAMIFLVYVGTNPSYSVLDALAFAVDEQIAPVVSVSYGACETQYSASDYASMNAMLAQAAAQGQSIVATSGDVGSTDCFRASNLTTTQQQALAVDFPASSQYVVAMGGTEFSAADVAPGSLLWTAAGTSDILSSVLGYIPEQVWNDDSSTNSDSPLASGGGGVSALTPRPTWQTGVPGIPSGAFRLLPDIAMTASPVNAPFLYCSSDTGVSVTGSCTHGFRDSNNEYLTTAGGTSFDAPIFAGMVAIINQKLNSTGQGAVAAVLYGLAANSSTYASAFHDITQRGNQCTAGSTYCSASGASQYAAATGYDQASGLGSVDFYNLLMAWPTSGPSLVASLTTLSAPTSSPDPNTNDVITITVASGSPSSTATPSGTMTVLVDGTVQTTSLALTAGTASYTFSAAAIGAHIVRVIYSGDTTYAGSAATIPLAVGGAQPGFILNATNVLVSAGTVGASIITITPVNGYTGTIGWKVSSSGSIANSCYAMAESVVSGAAAVNTSLIIKTSAADCKLATAAGTAGSGFNPRRGGPLGPVLAGGLLLALIALHIGKRNVLSTACLLLAVGLTVWSCGGGSSTPVAPKGTYTMTLVGTDSASSSITASTTFNLTIN